jgi:hypothetical protein
VPTPEAAQRFAEIDQGEHEVAAILGEYGKKSMASMQQYQAASNREAQQMNIPPNELMADAGPPPPSSGGRPPGAATDETGVATDETGVAEYPPHSAGLQQAQSAGQGNQSGAVDA